MNIETRILSSLQANDSQGCTAAFLKKTLKEEKKLINRLLYHDLSSKSLVEMIPNTQPPRWRLKINVVSPEKKNDLFPVPQENKQKQSICLSSTAVKEVIIVIDLGNIHDVLPQAEKFADKFQIWAFADYAFRGYGIFPKPKSHPNVKIYQSESRDKNSADIQIVFEIARVIFTKQEQATSYHFYVCTKDNGFLSLKSNVESYGHEMTFVKNWEELASHLLKMI